MTAFVKIEGGVVVQKQPNDEPGFIEAPDDVVCGMLFDGEEFSLPVIEPQIIIPDSVSSRQFKLQLLADGFLDDVEAWIAAQDRAVQIAYENSGSFVRAEPMMQAGFAALGFTEEQGDAFFTAAALL